MIVYRTEYLENKLNKYVAYYEGTDIDKAKKYKSFPIFGNPEIRVAKYERTGTRKFKYNLIEVLE